MDDTRTALLGQFREEVDTHLLRLSQGVVALEQDPANAELLKEIFRSAHTIKGAAKMMGFPEIARITHEMESVLGVMRDGRLTLSSDVSDLLLEGVEVITALTRLVGHEDDSQARLVLAEMSPAALVPRLQAVVDTATPEPPLQATSAAPGAIAAPRANGATSAGANGDGTALQAARAESPGMKIGDDSVRVRVQKLDALMNLSGEMVITRMQHGAITARITALQEMERNRGRRLATLREMVERSWGAINQADMEASLEQLRLLDTQVDDMTARTRDEFQAYAGRVNSVAAELEDTVLSVRMLPIDTLFSTFPLAVRNFKRETGKDVDLQVRGGETEIDKQILEALSDPLIHLLRNALDHGIERPEARVAAGKSPRGHVSVQAYPQGTQVVIEVSDDGAGIDTSLLRRAAIRKNILSAPDAEKLTDDETLNLIYYPGLSTAGIITDVSGRGVGMDIVKTTIERLNGSVTAEAQPGQGTRITLRLPLTLATMQALLVRVASQLFVLPSHTIEGGMEYITADDITAIENREVVRLKGRAMPLVRLEELLDLGRVESGAWLKEAGFGRLLAPRPAAADDGGDALDEDYSAIFRPPGLGAGIRLQGKLPGVIVGSGDRVTCFLVDELIDELDVVVKNLGPLLGKLDTATGATILADGRVVVILDVQRLLGEARARSSRGQLGRAWRPDPLRAQPHILVVDDSITTRELEKSILENAGYQVDIAMDGVEALAKLERRAQGGQGQYDLMIADIEMPRMDGLELTQQVKTHALDAVRAVPVIIVSSLASDAYKQRGVEVGAQAYMTKGQFDQGRLLETIDLLIH